MGTGAQTTWWQRNKYYAIATCAAAAGGVAALQLYKSKTLENTQAAILQTLQAIRRYTDACASTGDAVALLSQDIQQFLQSDSDDVPQSLRQLAKLAKCPEVQGAITACVASAVEGASAAMLAQGEEGDQPQLSLVDRILEAFLSDRGRSLVGLAVSVAARQSTEAFCEAVRQAVDAAFASPSSTHPATTAAGPSIPRTPSGSPVRQSRTSASAAAAATPSGLSPASLLLNDVLNWVSSPAMERLLTSVTATGMTSAVSTYMQHANVQDLWSPLLSAISVPEHKQALIDIMSTVSSSFCREMAAACIAPASTVAGSFSPPRPAAQPFLGGTAAASQPLQLPPAAGPCPEQQAPSLSRLPRSLSTRLGAGGSSTEGGDASGGSLPSTPRTGPGTPDPSLLAAQVVIPSRLCHHSHQEQQDHEQSLLSSSGSSSSSGSRGPGLHRRDHQQQQQQGVAGGGPDTVVLGPASSVISLLVQASRFQELRSLMVEVSRSSTHEFVASVLPAVSAAGLVDPVYLGAFKHYMYRMYVLLSVLVFLAVYALGPAHVLEGV